MSKVLSAVELGFKQKITSCTTLSGGTSHQSMLLKLDHGQLVVVKWIAPKNWLGVLDKTDIEFSESIAELVGQQEEMTVWANHFDKGQRLLNVEEGWILIKPFCPGRQARTWSINKSIAMGAMLASLHQLKLPKEGAKPFPDISLQGNFIPATFYDKMMHCNEHRLYKFEQMITSHRDIHADNVVWQQKNKPYLLDWESAGLIHPFVELIGVAVNASGIASGEFYPRRFTSVLLAYQKRAGILPSTSEPLWYLIYQTWLLWLGFLQREGEDLQGTLSAISLLEKHEQDMRSIYTELIVSPMQQSIKSR